MKLTSSRVQNFRSIQDSGQITFSPDNVTGLIGQNESGKTSFLEAQEAFKSGKISHEVVRSDGSVPSVSCTFLTDSEELLEIVEAYGNADEILQAAEEDDWKLTYIVEWNKNLESTSYLDGKLIDVFNINENDQTEVENTDSSPDVQQQAEKPENKLEILSEAAFMSELTSNHIPEFEFFEDFGSLLPNEIDLSDLESKNTKAPGYKGAINFLKIANCDVSELAKKSDRFRDNQVENINKQITADFSEFWSQTIGGQNKIKIEFEVKHHRETDTEKSGKPYLAFWVRNRGEKLYPEQRSKGVRWFLSFYLHLKASYMKAGKYNHVFLIDEPGNSLHARAQEDVLKLIEELKDKVQIIYTTHSPYLIDAKKIFRLIAVQRSDKSDSNSEFITAHELGAASSDTLTPLYTVMGMDLSHQNVIKKEGNIILEEISIYYYLEAFNKLFNILPKSLSFIPATGTSNVPQLVNLFLGWGLEFFVVVDDDSSGRRIYNSLKRDVYGEVEEDAKKHLLKTGTKGIEDFFSVTDFKKYILTDTAVDLEDKSNSEYAKKLSKGVLAYSFYQRVEDGKVNLSSLNKTSKTNIKKLLNDIKNLTNN